MRQPVQDLLHALWSASAEYYDKERDKPRWMRLQAYVDELVALEQTVRQTYGRAAAPDIRASLRRLDAIRRRGAAAENARRRVDPEPAPGRPG